jgi:uncharacterized iron-regulated protein
MRPYRSFASIAALLALCLFVPRPVSAVGGNSLLDLLREEAAGRIWQERKQSFLEYDQWRNGQDDLLKDLPKDAAAPSAAYRAKAKLVIHDLHRTVGPESFSRALKALTEGPEAAGRTWDGIRAAFEQASARDLGGFFHQWLDRAGLPDLRTEHATIRRNGSRFEIGFDLVQKGAVATLSVPVVVTLRRGEPVRQVVEAQGERTHRTLLVDDEPRSLTLDPEYDLPRQLTEDETPPLLATLAQDSHALLIPPSGDGEAYAGLRAWWRERGGEERTAADVRQADLKTLSVLVLGSDNPLLARLFGGAPAAPGKDLLLTVRKSPWSPARVVAIADLRTAADSDELVRLLAARELVSTLSRDGQGRLQKGVAGTDQGIIVDLAEEPQVVDAAAFRPFAKAIEGAAGKRIVYVGEFHDRFSHHNVELQVIEGVYRRNPQMAVGMEMFQRPFQPVLDDYVAGKIDEREFLKRSEYFKRWSFDYNLYKPLLDFARSKRIPVVALNLRREITDKVSREGMDALSAEERKELPRTIDFGDGDYRERLRAVFDQHKGSKERSFDFFYQAQVLWDETMAESVDEYLRREPGRQLVVVAGGGHLAYGSGIPKRAFRRNGLEYALILNDPDMDREIADYLVFPPALEGVTAPRLMVVLKEQDGYVTVLDVPENSVSRKAGIKAGDRILALDGESVKTVDDLKIALFYKQSDGTAVVRILRKRFLLGDRELDIPVAFSAEQ